MKTDDRKQRHHPPLVAILGPDGSGKSTVINGVAARLRARGLEMTTIHWRPNIVNHSESDGSPLTDPHGQVPRGYIESVLKLGMLFADWWVGYLTSFRRSRAAGILVISDRHYYDLLVDPIRYRFRGPHWLARLVYKCIPNPTLLILLDVSPEEIQRRKQEVPPEETERQVVAYRRVVRALPFGVVLDAGRPPEEVAEEATEMILSRYAPPLR